MKTLFEITLSVVFLLLSCAPTFAVPTAEENRQGILLGGIGLCTLTAIMIGIFGLMKKQGHKRSEESPLCPEEKFKFWE